MPKVEFRGKLIDLPEDYQKYVLETQTIAEASNEALHVIELERQDKQLGLYCRWAGLNKAMLKYWRFKHCTAIGGMPGSGKSYILNMLQQDFTDTVDIPASKNGGVEHKALNANFAGKVIWLHAGYEMDPADEILRTVSGKMNTSYSYLLSSHWDNGKFNKISNREIDEIKRNLDGLRNRPIYYVRNVGTTSQLYLTAYELLNKFPECVIGISNDHTLLNKPKASETNEIAMIAGAAKDYIRMRKDLGAMVIPLTQLNGNILSPERKSNPALHFPVYTDIHGSNQLYMAMDNTIVFHRPILINMSTYGEKDETGKVINDLEHLIHGAILKSRKGKLGNVWLREDLAHSKIHDASREDFIKEEEILY